MPALNFMKRFASPGERGGKRGKSKGVRRSPYMTYGSNEFTGTFTWKVESYKDI